MPFADFKDFDDCVRKIKAKNPNYSDRMARATCAKIEANHKKKKSNKKNKKKGK
jgi:hypothetical protein